MMALAALMALGPTPQGSPKTRIVALGDSTTAGTPGWKSPLEAPPRGRGDETSQYAYWLMQAHPEWEVLNRGVNGERSDEIRRRFDRDVLDLHPAAVVIIAGVNDVYQGRPVEHVIEQLRDMYDRSKRAGIRIVAGTIVPYNTSTPEQNDKMHRITAWIRSRADSDVAFVDTRRAVAAPGNPDKLIDSADSLHPSPAGYRLLAEAIQPVLEQLLRGR
jgi:lysophospholipase L1-like esterase